MNIYKMINKMMRHESEAEKLYKILNTDEYKERPYEYSDLGEGMAVIGETMWGWWKHRFLINHNTKRAYEFMDKDQNLVTVTQDDIDWESLKNLPEDAQNTAKALSFHFPSFIRKFENGNLYNITLGTFIELLRAIGFMQGLDDVLPELPVSPYELEKIQQGKRKRVRHAK